MITCDLVTVTLSAPGLDTVELHGDYAEGRLNLVSFDPGEADIREVVEDRPHADGTINTTEFFGERVITLAVAGDAPEADRLRFKRFFAPNVRSTITIENDSRFSLGRVVANECVRHKLKTVTLDGDHHLRIARWVGQFKVPLGLFEAPTSSTTLIRPSASAPVTGVEFDLEFPWSFGPPADPPGETPVDNPGEARCAPILRFRGLLDGPTLINQRTGRRISLPDLVIADGEFIEVNCLTGKVRVNGVGGASRLNKLDISAGRPGAFRLEPGENRLRLDAGSAGPSAVCEVIATPTYL